MIQKFLRKRKAKTVSLYSYYTTQVRGNNSKVRDKASALEANLENYEKQVKGKSKVDFILTYFDTFNVLHIKLIQQNKVALSKLETEYAFELIEYLESEAVKFFNLTNECNLLEQEIEIIRELKQREVGYHV